MRLIDVDKLKEAIEEEKDDNDYMCRLCLESIKEIIDEQPTAFDVDEVVDELKRLPKCSIWNHNSDNIDRTKAVEIVKRGGVDGEINAKIRYDDLV